MVFFLSDRPAEFLHVLMPWLDIRFPLNGRLAIKVETKKRKKEETYQTVDVNGNLVIIIIHRVVLAL